VILTGEQEENRETPALELSSQHEVAEAKRFIL
jgi:hypothetical protein